MSTTYRNTLLGCAIASAVAFFLPVVNIMIVSLSGFDMVRIGLGFGGSATPAEPPGPYGRLSMLVPLLMPLSAVAKLVTWYIEESYSHVGTAALAVVFVGYYAVNGATQFMGIGVWIWLGASVTCPIVAYAAESGQNFGNLDDGFADLATCAECGETVDSSDQYCGECGAELM